MKKKVQWLQWPLKRQVYSDEQTSPFINLRFLTLLRLFPTRRIDDIQKIGKILSSHEINIVASLVIFFLPANVHTECNSLVGAFP